MVKIVENFIKVVENIVYYRDEILQKQNKNTANIV